MPSMKNGNLTSPASPSALKSFFLASRPRTWSASLCPVIIGGAIAHFEKPLYFFITLLFSLFIQIGTNFANDYFDFIKGTDKPSRMGPKRATAEGWIAPHAMLTAALIAFAFDLLIGIPLMIAAGPWSIGLALLCVFFGIFYTGGPRPFGYLGLGELFVFPFFGPIATCGTYFLQTQTVTPSVFLASLAPGFLSCAILIANNLRDEITDRAAGKRTLVVRFGHAFGAIEYTLAILLASLIPLALVIFAKAPFNLASASLIFFLALPSITKAFKSKTPIELMPLLPQSSLLLLSYTFLFSIAAMMN